MIFPAKKPKIQKEPVILTSEQKRSIETMLMGPYLEEWKDEKGYVMNRDEDIAKRIGVPLTLVSHYTNRTAKIHFDNAALRIANDPEYLKLKIKKDEKPEFYTKPFKPWADPRTPEYVIYESKLNSDDYDL